MAEPSARATKSTPSERRSALRVIFELALLALVLAVPLLAVWSASSLAAYSNGPRVASVALGALLFPVLPALWELWSALRRRKRKATGPRITTLGDRITLRTLTLSVAFLAPMYFAWPAPLFQALTTRGDWFLDDLEASWAVSARHAVLGAADGLVWVYDATHENPWRDDGGTESVSTDGTGPGPMPSGDHLILEDEHGDDPIVPTPSPDPSTQVDGTGDVAPVPVPETPTPVAGPPRWPWADELHPLAHAPPETALVSIEALGAYFAAEVPDETERAKAVHDWIADHIAYDAVSYVSHTIPPQSAEAAFTTRTAVCAGYARLFESLGTAAGLHVELVVGDARHGSGSEPEGHAWNAIELGGAWALVDTTWDAGSVSGTEFTRRYSAGHFLVPAEVIGVSHFPDEERWQLRDPPLSRGEWNRQPMMTPAFFAAGLRLVSPDRAQIDGGPAISARIESTGGRFLLATIEPEGGGARVDCDVSGARTIDVRCMLPSRGAWTVRLYASLVRYSTYEGVASFDVHYL